VCQLAFGCPLTWAKVRPASVRLCPQLYDMFGYIYLDESPRIVHVGRPRPRGGEQSALHARWGHQSGALQVHCAQLLPAALCERTWGRARTQRRLARGGQTSGAKCKQTLEVRRKGAPIGPEVGSI